jgi:mannosyltransferase
MTTNKANFKPRIIYLILFIALAAGFLVRVHNLGRESLWYDEGHSIRMAHFGFSKYISEDPHELQHPLYFLLLQWWISVFGISEYAARFLSVIFGAGCILAIYFMGKTLFDSATGVISALFLACSAYQLQYSQEVKGYSLQALLGILSFYFFARMFKEKKWPVYAGYVLVNAASLYIHTFEAFILFAQNLFFFALLLLGRKKSELSWKKWLTLQGVIFLCFAPWLKVFIAQVAWGPKNFWVDRPDPSSLIITYKLFAGSSWLLAILGFCCLLALINRKSFSEKAKPQAPIDQDQSEAFPDRSAVWLLLFWMLVPVLTPWLVSLIWFPIFQPRYSIAAAPAVYLLAAKGIRDLGSKYARWLVVAIILCLSGLSIQGYFSTTNKEQWREAVGLIEQSAHPNDLVLVYKGDCLKNIYYYYQKRKDLAIIPYPEQDDRSPSPLESVIAGHDRAWLLVSHNFPERPLALSEQVAAGYHISLRQFPGIKIYFFRKKN